MSNRLSWCAFPKTKNKDANGNKYKASRWWSRMTLKRLTRTLPNGTVVLTSLVKWTARLRCIDGAPHVPAP